MAMTSCTTCSKEISREALSCPHCGQPNPAVKPKTRALGGLLVLGLIVWWIFGGGFISTVHDDAVKQALAEYQIASRSNDRTQSCVHAGVVAATYLQAKDEANYNQWLAIQNKECKSVMQTN